jgi:hypothetical protein
MPTRKIADLPLDSVCLDSEHSPPTHMFYEPGVYEHVCPSCGRKLVFTVPRGPHLRNVTP